MKLFSSLKDSFPQRKDRLPPPLLSSQPLGYCASWAQDARRRHQTASRNDASGSGSWRCARSSGVQLAQAERSRGAQGPRGGDVGRPCVTQVPQHWTRGLTRSGEDVAIWPGSGSRPCPVRLSGRAPSSYNMSGPPWVCTALGVSPQPLPAPLDVLQPILEVHLGLQHAAGQGEAQAPWDGGPPLGFEEPSAEGG